MSFNQHKNNNLSGQELLMLNSNKQSEHQNNSTEFTKEEDKLKKSEYNVLVIGKTGSGKTTLINMLLNLARKKEYQDERLIGISQIIPNGIGQEIELKCNINEFKSKQSDTRSDQSNSQTQVCNKYTVETANHLITLIDTPGFGDTSGVKKDEKSMMNIISQVSSLSQINCILYIHQGNDNRKNCHLDYYICCIKSLLPKAFQNNMITCFTSISNIKSVSAFSILQKSQIPLKYVVCFENSCLVPSNKIDRSEIKEQKNIWKKNQQQYKKLIEIIQKLVPCDVVDMIELFCEKEALMRAIHEKKFLVQQIMMKKRNLRKSQESYTRIKEQMKYLDPQKFKIIEVDVAYENKEIKNIVKEELLTFCFNCTRKCHNPCNLHEFVKQGMIDIKNCFAFKRFYLFKIDKCLECKCSYEYHGHTKYIYEINDGIEYCKEVIIQEKQKNESEIKDIEYSQADEEEKQIESENNNKSFLEIDFLEISDRIKNSDAEIKNLEKDLLKEYCSMAVLNKKIKEKSMGFNEEIFIKYMEEEIEKTKNKEIPDQIKCEQVQHYQNQIEIYKDLQYAQTQPVQDVNFQARVKQLIENSKVDLKRQLKSSSLFKRSFKNSFS